MSKAEKVTIMNVMEAGAVAAALQDAIDEADEMNAISIVSRSKEGIPSVIWAGLDDLAAVGLLDLGKDLIFGHMKKKQEGSNDE